MVGFESVEEQMEAAVGRVFPGAVLLVRDSDQLFYLRAFGRRTWDSDAAPMREDTIFDLSCLTRPLATSIAIMLLVRDGKLLLDDRVWRFFPNFSVHGKSRVTIRTLLSHCSGLPAWRPFYKQLLQVERKGGRLNFIGSQGARDYVYHEIEREHLDAPVGEKTIYSDLGFILLGAAVEALGAMRLDRFCHTRIFRPLGLRSTAFVDLAMMRSRHMEPIPDMIAPTEQCPLRKRLLCGEVQDENAWAMGGVAGHAGLFSSAREIDAVLVRLRQCYEGADDFIPQPIIREFWTVDPTVSNSTWALGWNTPSKSGSGAGSLFSAKTMGHIGSTGTSIWLDLDRKRHVVLLANPRKDNGAIRQLRPVLHDLINRTLGI